MRHQLDRYDSPMWFITAIAPYVDLSSSTVLEPCDGSGVLSNAVRQIYPNVSVITNDIDSDTGADYNFDATMRALWATTPKVDWVVSNPPFNNALPILQKAWDKAEKGMVFFLRTTWDEPCDDRALWLFNHPYTCKLTLPRFKFRKGANGRWQTDSATIAAYVWEFEKGRDGGKRTQLKRSLTIPKEAIPLFYPNPETPLPPNYPVVLKNLLG